MLELTLEVQDRFSLYTGVGSNDVPMPRRTITLDDFPTAPAEALGQPVPIIYGDTSFQTSSSLDAPTWKENWAKGLIWAGNWAISDGGRATGFSGNDWVCHPGDTPGGIAAPTNVTLADGAGGTIDTGTIVWANRIYGYAYCLDPSGVASDSYPYWPATVTAASYTGVTAVYDDFSADDRTMAITITWPGAATTGWTARVTAGYNYYGVRAQQAITLTYPSTVATFDAFTTTPLDQWGSWSLSTGAAWVWNGYQSPQAWFVIRAYDATGESPNSQVIRSASAPYKRPVYLEWNAVAGADGYRIYRVTDPTSLTKTRYWDVGDVTNTNIYPEGDGSITYTTPETPTRGIPVRYVGKLPDLNGTEWDAWLIAGHACKAVTNAYLNGVAIASSEYGGNLMLPGQTGFSSAFGTVYRDLGPHRYTLCYLRGALADAVLVDKQVFSVDVQGVESAGDGSGGLISDIYDQYAHWLEQWVIQDYQTGTWASEPATWNDTPWDVDIINTSSFSAAKAVAQARIAGGYTGATVIGSDGTSTVRTWMARWNQSADCYVGFNRNSQLSATIINDDPTAAVGAPVFSADVGILADSFQVDDDVNAIENRITARYRRDWVSKDWRAAVVAEDLDAQTSIGEVKPYELQLWCVTSAAQAWDIASRRLQRRKYPYRLITWTSDMGGLTLDLGDLVLVSHPDGVGEAGWTERPALIMRHEFDPVRFTITLTALDLDFAYAPVFGDLSWAAAMSDAESSAALVVGF